MTIAEKLDWLSGASDRELVDQLKSLVAAEAVRCTYGEGQADIDLTVTEILMRMGGDER